MQSRIANGGKIVYFSDLAWWDLHGSQSKHLGIDDTIAIILSDTLVGLL